LQRDGTYSDDFSESVRPLYAPPVDRNALAMEDRRLAILCRDLEIDCFLSTCATSAGGCVRTLLVAPPKPIWAKAGHGRTASHLASGFLIFSPTGPKYAEEPGIGGRDWIRQLFSALSSPIENGTSDPAYEVAQALLTASIVSDRAAQSRRSNADQRVDERARIYKRRSERRLTRFYERNSTAGPVRWHLTRLARAISSRIPLVRMVTIGLEQRMK
jgi:hypothetical protein